MNSSTNLRKPGKFVNAPVMKKDAMALVTGNRFIWMMWRQRTVWS